MRLHALIMAAVVEKPLVPISYDPKVDSFMKLLDIDNSLQINNLHTQELINSIETTWKNKEKIVQDLKEKTVILRQQAIKPTEMVMELLTTEIRGVAFKSKSIWIPCLCVTVLLKIIGVFIDGLY